MDASSIQSAIAEYDQFLAISAHPHVRERLEADKALLASELLSLNTKNSITIVVKEDQSVNAMGEDGVDSSLASEACGKSITTPVKSAAKKAPQISPEYESMVLGAENIQGVVFFGVNHKHAFYLPSSKSFIDGIHLRSVVLDSGCANVLLPVETSDYFLELFAKYSDKTRYSLSISWLKSSTGLGAALVVTTLAGAQGEAPKFEFMASTDVFGANYVCKVERLRFRLCTEDVFAILNDPHKKEYFTAAEIGVLNESSGKQIKRAEQVCLIGNGVFKNFVVVIMEGVKWVIAQSQLETVSLANLVKASKDVLARYSAETAPGAYWDEDYSFFDEGGDTDF